MKSSQSAGPSGVVAKMLKAAEEEGIELISDLVEEVFSIGMIPKDREESIILSLYKGKGEALDRGNNRGLKLTYQAMKQLERVLDFQIRQMVNIDEMQYDFAR